MHSNDSVLQWCREEWRLQPNPHKDSSIWPLWRAAQGEEVLRKSACPGMCGGDFGQLLLSVSPLSLQSDNRPPHLADLGLRCSGEAETPVWMKCYLLRQACTTMWVLEKADFGTRNICNVRTPSSVHIYCVLLVSLPGKQCDVMQWICFHHSFALFSSF